MQATELERLVAQNQRCRKNDPGAANGRLSRSPPRGPRPDPRPPQPSGSPAVLVLRARSPGPRGPRRPEVAQAIALLARKYDIVASVGWSIGQTRYAGILLFGADGELAAILDPDVRRLEQKHYALHAGTLLLFTTEDQQARFVRTMKDVAPKPGGWQTDHC